VPSDVTNVDNQIKAMVGEFEKSKEHGVLSGMSGGHHLGASGYFGPFRTVSDVTKHLADATQVAQRMGAQASQYAQSQPEVEAQTRELGRRLASADEGFVPGGGGAAARRGRPSIGGGQDGGGRGEGWTYGAGGWTYRTPGTSPTGISGGALPDISPGGQGPTFAGANLTGDQRSGRNLSRPVESQPIGPRSTDPTYGAGENQALDPTAHAGHNDAAIDRYRRIREEHTKTVAHIQRHPLPLHYTAPSPDQHSQRVRHAREATARRVRDQQAQSERQSGNESSFHDYGHVGI
jgi:hypothetical protein